MDRIPAHAGRPSVFCSPACRQAAHRRKQIPAAMRGADRWVRWTLRNGTKLPLRADANRAASVADRRTWTDYRTARASAVGEGIGIVLGGGVGCIDLDHCIAPDGTLSPLAGEVLRLNPDAWTELSMSGTGLHVFGRLDEAPGRRAREMEVYSRGRFIAITGDVWQAGRLAPLTAPALG